MGVYKKTIIKLCETLDINIGELFVYVKTKKRR